MIKLSNEEMVQVRTWMYRNARPLDLARWRFHFENGSKEEVINCLLAYQNEDGGFGHALEADSWNPFSSPITTVTAIELLHEIKITDPTHPVIGGILRYLDHTDEFTGKFWPAIIPSNNDYPHAPWWTYDENAVAGWGYNPTAKLAGFILRFADKESGIYKKAAEIAGEAIDRYLYGGMPDGALYRVVYREAEVGCFCYLLESLEAAGLTGVYKTSGLKNALKVQADTFIERDTSKWNQYCCKPSAFINSPESIFYEGNEEIVNVELDYIVNKRNRDGVWEIVWNWGGYEREFAIAENWWKGTKAVEYMMLLRNFKRL